MPSRPSAINLAWFTALPVMGTSKEPRLKIWASFMSIKGAGMARVTWSATTFPGALPFQYSTSSRRLSLSDSSSAASPTSLFKVTFSAPKVATVVPGE
jgi:hypothetical protein